MAVNSNENRLNGAAFEDLFLNEAKYRGLYVRKNHIAAKYGWKGRLIPVAGQLDFTVIGPGGRVGFFDAKSFKEDFFNFSEIDENQLNQSVLFNELGVPSGFVVYFRRRNEVVFFTGTEIHTDGPKTRFIPSMGLRLGSAFDFDLRPILRSRGFGPVAFQANGKKKSYKKNQAEVEFGHP